MEIGKLSDAYHGKKVFITGHTGFKGSWLSLWLSVLGAKTKGYALNPKKNSLYNLVEKSLRVQSVIADIRNQKKLEKEILAFQPDYVFHLAAQPLVRYSYQYPLETFEVNSIGTANLLHAVSKLKKKCSVIIITTDKVYENHETNYAYREEDKLGGHDPYSASKACAEIIVQSFRLSYFNPENYEKHKKSLAAARAGNVIGGGDFADDRIIPDMIASFKKNTTLKVRNPSAVRPWQYVLDPLSGYLILGAKMMNKPVEHSAAYNFGPSTSDILTVEELVKAGIKFWGRGKYYAERNKKGYHEAGLLLLDNSKAKNELHWHPKYDSMEAIKRTIEWYKKSLERNADIIKLCIDEIESYQSK